MIDLQTMPDHRTITPAEAEAALLNDYSAFVRLAYLILPPSLGRRRRILVAHDVVQHALPDHRRLERQLAGEGDAIGFVRRRVIQSAIKQATSGTPLRLLPQAWALRLFSRSTATDDLALSKLTPDARAAWALLQAERLPVDDVELQLRATGIHHAQAAINDAAEYRDDTNGKAPALFNPCTIRLAPTDLMRRKARGRAVAIAATTLLTLTILISLLATAGH